MFPNDTPKLDIPYGYCHCGCGQKTKIATQTMSSRGWTRNKPTAYLHGHNARHTSPIDIFWSRVDKSDGEDACWIWIAGFTHGYGLMRWNGRNRGAHTIAYLLTYGEYDESLEVMHACDNPPCVNPKHLKLGTHQENMDDMERKGRGNGARGENNEKHKLSDAQVIEIRRRYQAGETNQSKLGREYHVSSNAIRWIVKLKRRV